MKQIFRIASNAVFWVPFAFAAFLCWEMLSDRENAWPAFYSFLPMAFFFIGAAFMVLVRRIGKLEKVIESQTLSLTSESRAVENRVVLDEPAGWSYSAVGTWPRFLLMATFFVMWPFVIVYVAIDGGWRGAIGAALFLGLFQLRVLSLLSG